MKEKVIIQMHIPVELLMMPAYSPSADNYKKDYMKNTHQRQSTHGTVRWKCVVWSCHILEQCPAQYHIAKTFCVAFKYRAHRLQLHQIVLCQTTKTKNQHTKN